MSSERDELAQLIDNAPPEDLTWKASPRVLADAILSAGYRRRYVILTDSELAKLPADSLFLDVKGRVWRAFADGDHDCLEVVGVPSTVPLPATVLYVPEEP